jgi:(p)ppGpp synthase/HD superfamily hydrolase
MWDRDSMTNRTKPAPDIGPTREGFFGRSEPLQPVERALVYAAHVHAEDVRRDTTIPYLSHLLSVAALVMEDGGDETQVIAALLHDAAEDHGGEERLSEIEQMFGGHVAYIVRACSDSLVPEGVEKEDWSVRKNTYLARLGDEPVAVLRVSLADKLHNARCILADYRQIGDKLWSRFSGGKEGTLSYYHRVVEVFESVGRRAPPYVSPMLDELKRVVGDLDGLVGLSKKDS